MLFYMIVSIREAICILLHEFEFLRNTALQFGPFIVSVQTDTTVLPFAIRAHEATRFYLDSCVEICNQCCKIVRSTQEVGSK